MSRNWNPNQADPIFAFALVEPASGGLQRLKPAHPVPGVMVARIKLHQRALRKGRRELGSEGDAEADLLKYSTELRPRGP